MNISRVFSTDKPSMYDFVVAPVEAAYNVSSVDAPPVEDLTVMSKFENLLLLTAENYVNFDCTHLV